MPSALLAPTAYRRHSVTCGNGFLIVTRESLPSRPRCITRRGGRPRGGPCHLPSPPSPPAPSIRLNLFHDPATDLRREGISLSLFLACSVLDLLPLTFDASTGAVGVSAALGVITLLGPDFAVGDVGDTGVDVADDGPATSPAGAAAMTVSGVKTGSHGLTDAEMAVVVVVHAGSRSSGFAAAHSSKPPAYLSVR